MSQCKTVTDCTKPCMKNSQDCPKCVYTTTGKSAGACASQPATNTVDCVKGICSVNIQAPLRHR